MSYFFFSKIDKKMEPIGRIKDACSRLIAAKYFAQIKRMPLKDFLKVFSVAKESNGV
jgi:hypothetical protein